MLISFSSQQLQDARHIFFCGSPQHGKFSVAKFTELFSAVDVALSSFGQKFRLPSVLELEMLSLGM